MNLRLALREIGKKNVLCPAALASDEQVPLAWNEVKGEDGHEGNRPVLPC